MVVGSSTAFAGVFTYHADGFVVIGLGFVVVFVVAHRAVDDFCGQSLFFFGGFFCIAEAGSLVVSGLLANGASHFDSVWCGSVYSGY